MMPKRLKSTAAGKPQTASDAKVESMPGNTGMLSIEQLANEFTNKIAQVTGAAPFVIVKGSPMWKALDHVVGLVSMPYLKSWEPRKRPNSTRLLNAAIMNLALGGYEYAGFTVTPETYIIYTRCGHQFHIKTPEAV